MKWSKEQEMALVKVNDWYKSKGNKVFRLFGYAGTGKTTLAKHIADSIGGEVLFAAYTGKAAHVLKQKGCKKASTIHSLVYTCSEKGIKNLLDLKVELAKHTIEAGPLRVSPKVDEISAAISKETKELNKPQFQINYESPLKKADLLIIDECSMVDSKIGNDILSLAQKVLVLGDPAQLPPISGEGGFFTENCTPDYMLTEIHRQARDNPIILLATNVREGRSLVLGQYGGSSVILKSDIDKAKVIDCDQVLVGRNATRGLYNTRIRQLKGFDGVLPAATDKLICLRNNDDLLNGSMWNAITVDEHTDQDHMTLEIKAIDSFVTKVVSAHKSIFYKREFSSWSERLEANEFDFGYAITVHKSQGSQWDDVVLFDESSCFKEKSNRWLYTAITRAAKNIQIVL